MIDIIIPTYNSNIEKCLFSILMQTVKDKINVYVIDNCSDVKYDSLVDKFKNFLNIKLIRLDKKYDSWYVKQVGLDNSFENSILFLNPEDSLYDCYSISNLCDCIKGKKYLISSFFLVEKKDGTTDKIVDDSYLYGKIFSREVIRKNNLSFDSIDDFTFTLLYSSTDIVNLISDSIVYVIEESNLMNDFRKNFSLENIDNYSKSIICYVENAEKRKLDKKVMGKNIYHALVIFFNTYINSYKFSFKNSILKISKKILEYYRSYKYFVTYEEETEIFFSIKGDSVPVISIEDFFELVSSYDEKETSQDDLISIIVPIYNKEKYLSKTITSILNQTYKNFELLLIDDCSTDNSVKLCEEFREKDKRIKIIKNEKNSGVSETRNVGLDNSLGKYICFVDADDTIDSNMYEVLHSFISKYDCDFVQCMNKGSKINLESDVQFINGYDNIFGVYLAEDKISDTVWSKIFRSDVLKDVRFNTEFRKHEDTLFVFEVLKKCKKICLISDELYNYHCSVNSLTNVKIFDSEIKLLEIIRLVEKYIRDNYDYMFLLLCWYKLAKVLYFLTVIKNVNLKDSEKKYLKNLFVELNGFVEEASELDYWNLKKYNILNKMIKEFKSKIN